MPQATARRTAKEMLAALYSAEPQPEPEPRELPRGWCSGLLELSDELLHEVLLHVAADEPECLARMERVAAHFWRPRRALPQSEGLQDVVLPRGARVTVHGCQSRAGQALNGLFATVCGYDEGAGRYMLAVAGVERRKKLQRGNITCVASAPEVAAAAAVSRRVDRWRVERRKGESWKQVLHLLHCCLPPLRRLSCGSMHTVATDAAGRVWSFGLGTNGQLGHGSSGRTGDDNTVAATDEGQSFPVEPTPASFLLDAQETRPRPVSFDTHQEGRRTVATGAVVAGGGSTFALADGTGELWAWGRLADRSSIAAEKYIASPSLQLCRHPVSVISARDNHAALVTAAGTLFTWGEGSLGQLGHGFGLDYYEPHEVEISAKRRAAAGDSIRPGAPGSKHDAKLSATRITNVACSSFATMILTACGELMMCGQVPRSSVYDSRDARAQADSRDTPMTSGAWDWGVLQPPANSANRQALHDADLVAIHDILSGNSTSTSESSSNIGAPAMVPVLSPTPVVALRDVIVRGVACGQDYFGAATDGKDGHRLYTWGRLHARSAIVAEPTLVMLPSGGARSASARTPATPQMRPLDCVSLVAMGMEHVAVLTKSTGDDFDHENSYRVQLWTWGSGTQGQLGHGDTISTSLPREVVGLRALVEAHGQVTSISAGNEHTALMFDDGALCAFGCGYFGRLGLGTEDNWARPRLLEQLGVQ